MIGNYLSYHETDGIIQEKSPQKRYLIFLKSGYFFKNLLYNCGAIYSAFVKHVTSPLTTVWDLLTSTSQHTPTDQGH